MDISAEYQRFAVEHESLAGNIRFRQLPHLDHSVFGNLENEGADGWIPIGTPITLFIAEAPPWSYSETSKSPYFYSADPGSGVSDRLLRALGIACEEKSARLLQFKKQGGLLLDSIKCPVKIDEKMKRRSEEFSDLVKVSSRFLRDELLELKNLRRSPKCIVALGASALAMIENLCGTRGGLPGNGELVDWMKKHPDGKFVKTALGPVLPWFMPSGANAWANESFGLGTLKNAVEMSFDAYTSE